MRVAGLTDADWVLSARGTEVRPSVIRVRVDDSLSDRLVVATIVHETMHAREWAATPEQQQAMYRAAGMTSRQWLGKDVPWNYRNDPSEKMARAAAYYYAGHAQTAPTYDRATFYRLRDALS